MSGNVILLAQATQPNASQAANIGIALALFLVAILILIGVVWLLLRVWRARLRRRGYADINDYFRSFRRLPQTNEEKLAAIELTLKGAVILVLGRFFPLLVVIALVPLYYGVRKLAALRLGLEGHEEDQGE